MRLRTSLACTALALSIGLAFAAPARAADDGDAMMKSDSMHKGMKKHKKHKDSMMHGDSMMKKDADAPK